MARFRDKVIRAGFEALHLTGAHEILSKFCGGVGTILTFHHVRPPRPNAFQPNGLLEVTPEFLNEVVGILRDGDIDLISLDEMQRRMVAGNFRRRFACITFDDGYRDNKQHAYPVLKKHNVPFAIYVPTSFIERRGELWWLTLEAVIAANDRITIQMDETLRVLDCHTVEEKQSAYSEIYWWLRGLSSDDEIRSAVRDLAARYHVDLSETYDSLCMTWRELAELSTDPLVTIGAHTINHPILAKTSADVARREIEAGAAEIARVLGRWPTHLSYPFGDATSAGQREFAIARELGFKTAVTTRPGVLFPEHRDYLMALPRISINGEYQDARYVEVLLSGTATALWNGFRHVNAA
ncbi:MAG: polysaccharide deacetylase family protein [Xanthobacteraceae bacterium]